MNSIELKMVEVLKELKNKYYVDGVKAEFEAEGTRTDELVRLKELCLAADVSLTLKIGGCEAIRDMYDARAIGVNHLVAPMVETAFSLQKYLRAVDMVFPFDEQENVDFVVNVETEKAVNNFDEMLKIPEIDKLDCVVIGRVDLTGSMGLDRKSVNDEKIFKMTEDLFKKAKAKGLKCILGGAISVESLPFLRNLKDLIVKYETRKICFKCPAALGEKADDGISKAVEFELLWLKNKQKYYKEIAAEDEKRIVMMEARLNSGIK